MSSNRNTEQNTEDKFIKNKEKRKKRSERFGKKKTASKEKKSSSKRRKVLKIAAIVLAVILGILLLAALSFGIYYFSLGEKVDNKGGFITGDEHQEGRKTTGDAASTNEDSVDIGTYEYYTFLATATDNSGNLTDAIMVATFHYVDSPSVSVLQIPRDTYVKVASKLYFNEDGTLSEKNFDPDGSTYATKINTVFNHGRKLASSYIKALLKDAEGKSNKEIEDLCKQKDYIFLNADADKVIRYVNASKADQKKSLESNISTDFGITYLSTLIYHYFGIPIDYQAQVSIRGFRGIVDAVGGVDLTVPQRMYYNDPYQDLHIDLHPGFQHLDGEEAEGFVRFRRYLRGDVDRLDAQKIFINAFLDKLLTPSIVTKIDDIIGQIQENLYTSVSFNDMLRFAKKLLKMNLSQDISLITLPGVGEYVGEVSYFIAYRDEAATLINEKFNVYEKPIDKSSLMMIDYNDVISGNKPAIQQSTLLDKPTQPVSTPDNTNVPENTETENAPANTVTETTPENTEATDDSSEPSDNSSEAEVIPPVSDDSESESSETENITQPDITDIPEDTDGDSVDISDSETAPSEESGSDEESEQPDDITASEENAVTGTPSEEPEEAPLVDVPDEMPDDTAAVEDNSESSVDASAVETPAESPVDTPAVEAPAEAPVEAPAVETPTEAPVEEAPDNVPGETADNSAEEALGDVNIPIFS